MNDLSKAAVSLVTVDEGGEGQRIDNFLAKQLKGVPKSHLYRILRSGEVRVNSKRVDATHRLALGEVVRIPPVRTAAAAPKPASPVTSKFDGKVLFEDDVLLVIDKPAGIAVHGGSGISRGVIEQLRLGVGGGGIAPLVHRFARDHSGVLLLAKKRSTLVALHEAIRGDAMEKRYLILVCGEWKDKKRRVRLPLKKYTLESGERRVSVDEEGQSSETIFHLRQSFGEFTLLEAELITGRTHQLRVQLAHLGFPIAGDDKYGDYGFNKALQKRGLKRMFLHSAETVIRHPLTGKELRLTAPLPKELAGFLNQLEKHAKTL
ncbi:MAG TPA: RluA family pseudouridine synthase [Methylophilaceae bacterium]|nr:RluA family pseudouridine synthase [Methylophilaceae bacterium]